jgi:uncharacterized membrane protein YdfJ with MMPL/SSD domain
MPSERFVWDTPGTGDPIGQQQLFFRNLGRWLRRHGWPVWIAVLIAVLIVASALTPV